jgi:hypothetical protein
MKGEKRRWEMSLILDIVEALVLSRQKQQQGEKDG